MTPQRPAQIRCPIRGDAHDTIPTVHRPAAGRPVGRRHRPDCSALTCRNTSAPEPEFTRDCLQTRRLDPDFASFQVQKGRHLYFCNSRQFLYTGMTSIPSPDRRSCAECQADRRRSAGRRFAPSPLQLPLPSMPLTGEDGFTIAVAAPVGMEAVSRHRRHHETSPIAMPSASSGKGAAEFTGSNPAVQLAGIVLGIHFPKRK